MKWHSIEQRHQSVCIKGDEEEMSGGQIFLLSELKPRFEQPFDRV